MKVGTRVIFPDEIDQYEADFLQVSVYRPMKGNVETMKDCVRTCRERAIPYVLHPVGYSLLDDMCMKELRVLAEWANPAFIVHDERTPGGERLHGEYESRYMAAVGELGAKARVSIENAAYTKDALWFWARFAKSITFDIGHVEAAGMDSVEFVKNLGKDMLDKIEYVHMHRNNGPRRGLTDHWPLTPGCRELKALGELIRRKPDVGVLLELNETEMTFDNLALLRKLREEAGAL